MLPIRPQLFTADPATREDDCACPDKAFRLIFRAQGREITHDCACSDEISSIPLSWSDHAGFIQSDGSFTAVLPDGFHLAFSPYAPAGPTVLNPAAYTRWQSFAAAQPLSQEVDHLLAREMLIHPQGMRPQPIPQPPHTLTAWLHITNACNLDCPYCYVRKSSARMNEATGLRAVEAIFHTAQQQGFKQVKLKYAGGEAALHFQLVRRLHQHAQTLAQETGIMLKAVILSNGTYLKPAQIDWLQTEQVKLMISLDGVGEAHNRLRPLKNRPDAATFPLVERTIDQLLRPRGVTPDITMTITGVNAGDAAALTYWALIERDLPLTFNFYRQNPLAATRTDLELEEEAILQGMLAAYAVIEKHLPTRPFLNGLLDRIQAEAHTHTCGVGQSYLVITHTGQVAQCQMHLDAPLAPVTPDNLLPLVAAGPLHNLSVDQKEGCRTCQWRYRCAGGCPLETYRATGRWDIQSPNCHLYQTLYPHALRLEGLRLMKINKLTAI